MQIEIYGQMFEIKVAESDKKPAAALIYPLLYFVQCKLEERVVGVDKAEADAKKAELTPQDFMDMLEEFTNGPRKFPQFINAWSCGAEIALQSAEVPFERPTFFSGGASPLCMRLAKKIVAVIKAEKAQQDEALQDTGTEG